MIRRRHFISDATPWTFLALTNLQLSMLAAAPWQSEIRTFHPWVQRAHWYLECDSICYNSQYCLSQWNWSNDWPIFGVMHSTARARRAHCSLYNRKNYHELIQRRQIELFHSAGRVWITDRYSFYWPQIYVIWLIKANWGEKSSVYLAWVTQFYLDCHLSLWHRKVVCLERQRSSEIEAIHAPLVDRVLLRADDITVLWCGNARGIYSGHWAMATIFDR